MALPLYTLSFPVNVLYELSTIPSKYRSRQLNRERYLYGVIAPVITEHFHDFIPDAVESPIISEKVVMGQAQRLPVEAFGLSYKCYLFPVVWATWKE
ncbi:MAG: hypothetical protein ACFFCW_25510 [Candidatus Hodarchaeota archaeon]